ncbi:MAG TPA: glutaredoxin domain-containing protein [Actinomycetes bacterium]|nr:glutaredoxin domain-containing protein [Actinomycetes bacterium]
MHSDPQPAMAVEVYWRPGCGFCSTLRRALHRTGLPLREINIWDDPDAAALVRRLASGSETVPTVVVGPRALVNPTVGEVLAAVAAEAPHLLPIQQPPAPRTRVSARWWAPLASVGLAALWVGLAAWHPTTTYHLGPALAAAAWPRLARWRASRRLEPLAAAVAVAGGAATALSGLALLVALHALQGPTLLGRHSPIVEALALLAVGCGYGLWAASRPARRSGKPSPPG